ncbi:MAG: hypothetical protein P8I34_00765 [Flavobacteriaceae bacterium]|jgi:hypothetical protein|nr:hypothetical protein [Flavobacteriaceae bacterium]
MFNNIFIKPIIALFLFVLIFACSKDEDPEPAHEEEIVTLVTLEVSKVGSSETIKYNFEVEGHDHDDHEEEEEEDDDHDDHDGEHTEIELEANSSYNVSMFIYNDTDPNNIENITQEIIEEKDEHQVFYAITDELSGFSIEPASDDTVDSNGNSLYIKTTWTTTGETSGDVVGYLIHEPTQKTGTTRTDFGGATDFEIDFEVHVE